MLKIATAISSKSHKGLAALLRNERIDPPPQFKEKVLKPLLSWIPANLPAEQKQEIANLYSSDALTRARAAHTLGAWSTYSRNEALGPAALPFLETLVGDYAELKWVRYSALEPGTPTSPSEEASKAISLILSRKHR